MPRSIAGCRHRARSTPAAEHRRVGKQECAGNGARDGHRIAAPPERTTTGELAVWLPHLAQLTAKGREAQFSAACRRSTTYPQAIDDVEQFISKYIYLQKQTYSETDGRRAN